MRPALLAGALAMCMAAGAALGQGVLRNKTFIEALAAGECPKNGDALSDALAQPSAELLVLAGWLNQWGVCMKPNPDHAWAYYERAHRMGAPSAATRLAGLAATPGGGADVAAVLWWARKTTGERGVHLGDCDPLPGRADVSDTEFVEALKPWSQEKLHRCRGEVGFRALVIGEIYYPMKALFSDEQGAVRLEYELQTGQVTVRSIEGPPVRSLVGHVERMAARAIGALPRTPQPIQGGINFVFRTTE